MPPLPPPRSAPADARAPEEAGGTGAALRRLNECPAREAERTLLTCCGSPGWAARVAAHRPYPDGAALLAAAEEASYDMSPDDVAEALAGECAQHPLSLGPGALAAHTALRAAHAAYESRFGHAFVLCLDGFRPEERLDQMLAALRARLGNDPDEERALAAEELRGTVRGRLTRLVEGTGLPAAGARPSVPD
jgi:2-oxo-4-hydroxy-4-carboxy-5-ureidoimidazoline decarboxylase